jgi:hypothetical protein
VKKLRKIIVTCIAAAMFMSAYASVAHALPVFEINSYYQFKFKNYEDWFDVDKNGVISVGDQFQGILGVTEIYKSDNSYPNTPSFSSFTPVWSSASATDQLTGTFDFDVLNVVPLGGGPINLVLSEGVYNLYHNTAKTFSAVYPGTGATDGSLWAKLMDLQLAVGYVAPPFPSFVSSTTAYMQIVTDYTGVPFGWNVLNYDASFPADTQFFVQSTIAKVSGLAYGDPEKTNWTFSSDDPFISSPATPEPASMLLLGMGLVGLAALRRKKVA